MVPPATNPSTAAGGAANVAAQPAAGDTVLLTVVDESEVRLAPVGERPVEVLPRSPRSLFFWVKWITGTIRWCFGFVSLVLLLAVLATIPLLQLLSLGYLLEVSGRIARTSRLRVGFIGINKAAIAGGALLGCWLLLLPLRIAATMWSSAILIDPQSPAARGWRVGLFVLTVLIGVHAVGAFLRGGRLRSFLIPRPILTLRMIFRRDALARARDGLWDFVTGLRLPYYFWLGARGFFGAFVWLIVPTTLLAISPRVAPQMGGLVGITGGLLLIFVLLHLPLLQAAFAAENRLGAMFEIRRNRQRFRRAPIAYLLALLGTLVLAVPLFLLKIEMIPQEAAWLPSIFFVIFMYPARILTGWACSRAERRQTPRHWFWRWVMWLPMFPVAGIYVLLTYFTQYLSWHGVWSLYEQHAFLVPVPFLGF